MGDESTGATAVMLKTIRDLGGWFGKHVDGPMSEISGMIQERLKFARAVRVMRLAERFKFELEATGRPATMRSLAPNFLLPALEEGAMEDDDDLQDVWARLLANVCDPATGVSPKRSHITMLKEMTPLDAMVFEAIYSVSTGEDLQKAILTCELPGRASIVKEKLESIQQPSHEVAVSIANLERIGVVLYGPSWGGGEVLHVVNQSILGKELFKAIKRRTAC